MKLHPKLKKWIKEKDGKIKIKSWHVGQSFKKTDKPYPVGTVVDYVYAHDHPEYLHIILKIKPDTKGPFKRNKWVTKAYYMTLKGKDKGLVYGQRPIVTSTRCFQSLIRKAEKKGFF